MSNALRVVLVLLFVNVAVIDFGILRVDHTLRELRDVGCDEIALEQAEAAKVSKPSQITTNSTGFVVDAVWPASDLHSFSILADRAT